MRRPLLLAAACLLAACSSDEAPPASDDAGDTAVDIATDVAADVTVDAPDAGPVAYDLTLEEMMDPASCAPCHSQHYREWSGSMHAYAAEDPIFVAMNARGQEETDGALGDFCVQCHAPMAVRTGATTDGLNLDELDDSLLGVTCYFCHNVVDVQGTHNNPLVLANDLIMRGGLEDPVPTSAHGSAWSPLHDRNHADSSAMCGSCHDVVLDNGVALERTYQEWQHTIFADTASGFGLSCNSCHMRGRNGLAATLPGMPERRVHAHTWPGVDVALTDFPEREEQRALVQRELDSSLLAQVCVFPEPGGATIRVELENIGAGHNWPSGAAHDRRAWVEVQAFRDDAPVFSSGVLAPGQALAELDDPHLWRMGDEAYDEQGEHATMFWEVASLSTTSLPAQTTLDETDPRWIDTHIVRTYPIADVVPDRVTVRVLIRPFGLEIIDDLIASGHLDPAIRATIPTFELAPTVLEWTSELGRECQPESIRVR